MSDQELVPSDGCLILIVGPSGSGKDTLISWLKDHLVDDPNYLFVKRTVTRHADAGSEDHDTLSEDEFETAEAAGEFAVTWQAHGLRYGIPGTVLEHVNSGRIAIANGSRRALADIERAFDKLLIINLKVDRAVLAKRLAARGRETAEQIEKRLAQMDLAIKTNAKVVDVDNSVDINRTGQSVLELMNSR